MNQTAIHTLLCFLLCLSLAACKGNSGSNENDHSDLLFPQEVLDQADKSLSSKCQTLQINKDSLLRTEEKLSVQEKNALLFLYAYLITPDMLDYSGEYYLKNIRASLTALEEMPWGNKIPAQLVRHFVLPVRVNNEALDNSRELFYAELKNRVKGLSMRDAVLEVNHWCNEHVTYAPSSARTLSPKYTMQNALGRCGEESTYTVAALRAIGIPARQVYTPRWAHTDDNHAWVEAWVDGQWYYLGACEPAPVLNNAWFDAPVKRAMMLHTKAFGNFEQQDETILKQYPTYTELNLSSLYVPTGKAKVQVLDTLGQPIPHVDVFFRLYNYSEFYPLAQRQTDKDGLAELETGLGDLLVTAGNNPTAMGMAVVKAGGDLVKITLKAYDEFPNEMHWKLTPPPAVKPQKDIDSLLLVECNQRILQNDSIRKAYLNSFPTDLIADQIADSLGIKDRKAWRKVFKESRGHQSTIRQFIQQLAPEKRELGVMLLGTLETKDLHDVSLEVLNDAIEHYQYGTSPDDQKYLLCPRVYNEQLFPLGNLLTQTIDKIRKQHPDAKAQEALADATAQYLKTFTLDHQYNPIRHALSPKAVLQHHLGDPLSLSITFVRLMRSAGIPAEYDAAIALPKIRLGNGRYKIYSFEDQSQTNPESNNETCRINLKYKAKKYLNQPKFYYNFTLGHVDDTGQMQTYDFPDGTAYDDPILCSLEYDKNYLITGTRLADGTVLARFTKIRCNQDATILFDEDKSAIEVIGSMNPEQKYYDYKNQEERTLLSSTGRGYFIMCIVKEHHEPSDHILRDFAKALIQEDATTIPIVVLKESGDQQAPSSQTLLPQAIWGEDRNSTNLKMLVKGLEQSLPVDLPMVAVCDTFGRIVYVSNGYTIGLGEQLKKLISELE